MLLVDGIQLHAHTPVFSHTSADLLAKDGGLLTSAWVWGILEKHSARYLLPRCHKLQLATDNFASDCW